MLRLLFGFDLSRCFVFDGLYLMFCEELSASDSGQSIIHQVN